MTKLFKMKNMKTWLYVIVGLMVFLNWDKISGMIGKKKDGETTEEETK